MMKFNMNSPTPIYFECGLFDRLSEFEFPGKNALIVLSDDHIAQRFSLLERLTEQLDAMGIRYSVFDGVQPNPIVENVMDGSEIARKNQCDFIIGLGGGSVMDCAKAISLLATNDGNYWDYVEGMRIIEKPRIPVVTIPTTAGTGTEIAPFFVITNEEKNEKVGFPKPMRYNTWPVLSIIDPALTATVPPEFTAYQGFDAFAHCVESFLSKKANAMSNMYSLACVEAVSGYLAAAVHNGGDFEARSRLSFASVCSGVVMSVGSSTSKHSLEHAMSAYHNELPHGAGLLMICRAYYRKLISKQVLNERFIELARAMGKRDASAPEDFVAELDKLMHICGVDELKMSDYGISPDEFEKYINNARTTSIGYLFNSDSVILSDEDCMDIYRESYK